MYIPQQFPLACQNDKSKHSNKCCDQVANQHYETKNQNTFPLAPDAGDQKSGSDYPGTAAINDAEYKYEQVLRHIWQNKYNGYQRFYTPTMFQGEISATYEVFGIQIDASDYAEYIDILGLTEDEKNELEAKIAELKSRNKHEKED